MGKNLGSFPGNFVSGQTQINIFQGQIGNFFFKQLLVWFKMATI